jgi:ABC-type multidrug transport system permease subunit
VISKIFPAQYYMTITRTVFLKGGSFEILAPQFAALTIFAVAIVILSSLVYRERV